MKGNARKILVVLLLVVTAAMAAGALYFGYQLSQDDVTTAPRDTSADDNDGDGYVDPFWNIGGWPDQSVINQYYECGLTVNPCAPNTGHDAYCICPEDAYPSTIGCLVEEGQPERNEPVNFTEKRQGQSLGCGPRCGNGRVETGEQCDDGNTINDDQCSNACLPPGAELTCYRCTLDGEDGNACESQAVTTATCPDGWTTNSNCQEAATGGQCPAEVQLACRDVCTGSPDSCPAGTTCMAVGDTQLCVNAQCSGDTDCNCDTTPPPPPPGQCEDLTVVNESGDVAPGDVLVIQVDHSGAALDPDDVVLRVSLSTNDTPVGRDQRNPSSALVEPLISSDGTNVLYIFYWEAINTNNSALTAGDYDIEVSFDGGVTFESAAACRDTFTFNPGETPEPAFLIIKQASVVCTAGSGARVTYTVRVENVGPVEGVIDYVEDVLESGITASMVSSISSSRGIPGSYSNGTIRWTGTEDQRTYAPDESATFTYVVTLTASQRTSLGNNIGNQVTVVYGDNQNRYNLVTTMNCPGGGLPQTGIEDQTPLLIGIVAIIMGVIAYRMGFGQELFTAPVEGGKSAFSDTVTKVGYKLGFGEVIREHKRKRLEDEYNDD